MIVPSLEDSEGKPLPTDNEQTPSHLVWYVFRNRVRHILDEKQKKEMEEVSKECCLFSLPSLIHRTDDSVSISELFAVRCDAVASGS